MTSDPDSILDPGTLERHSDPVLAQFLSALDVRVTAIASKVTGEDQKILQTVQASLKSFPTLAPEKIWGLFQTGESERPRILYAHWTEAFRLERLLALIEPADTLLGETARRVKEANDESILAAASLKIALDAARKAFQAADPATSDAKQKAELGLRMLLLETLEELHATYQARYVARPLLKTATLRTIRIGLLTFCLFLAPYFYAYATRTPPDDTTFKPFALFPFWSALTAGLFGAFFSRLMSLQTNAGRANLDVLKDAREWTYILSRGFVGMCGALIVFFFLQAGLLSGNLFPKFAELGLGGPVVEGAKPAGHAWTLILPNEHLALLVVWCFLAGFSERLVPNVLATTEKTLNNAIDKGK